MSHSTSLAPARSAGRSLVAVVLLFVAAFATPAAAQFTVNSWKAERSPVLTQLFGVAWDEDAQTFHIVGDQGLILSRDMQAPGLGTWMQQPTDLDGMQPQLLDIVCRPGVGCAASGIDVVLVNTDGSWVTLVDTRGSSRAYGPVWLLDDAVVYGELSFPLNFLWRQELSGDPGFGIAVGNQPVVAFCEREGELVTIDTDGNVIGYPFNLDANQLLQYVGPTALGLSTAGFVDDACATTPRGVGADSPAVGTPGAIGVVQSAPTTWRPRLLHDGVWQAEGSDRSGLVLAVIEVVAKNALGFQESFGVGMDVASTFGGYWDFLSFEGLLDFGPPMTPDTVSMTSYYQVASARGALGPLEGLEVLVGDAGLITVRSFLEPEPPLFRSTFEIGDFSEWSSVFP